MVWLELDLDTNIREVYKGFNLRHYANQPACPICISNPISHLLTVGSTPPIQHSNSVLNVKAVVALVGAFSVIVQLREGEGWFDTLVRAPAAQPGSVFPRQHPPRPAHPL